MSSQSGGEYIHGSAPEHAGLIPVKTLATSGLYIDRRAIGPQVTAVTDEIAAVAAQYEGVEINVPDKNATPSGNCAYKDLAVNLVMNSEIENNRRLIGHVPKFAAMAKIIEINPTIIQPMSEVVEDEKVVFSHLLAHTDEYSGDTYFNLFPDERTFRQLRLEQVRSWLALAKLAKIAESDFGKLDIKKPHFDLRVAFVKGGTPYKAIQRITEVLVKHDKIEADLMPGIEPDKYFKKPELVPEAS